MVITRKVSSTFRVVIEIIKVIFVWIFEICYYDIKELRYDQAMSYFWVTLLKLFGYLFILFGNVLINEILRIGVFGLDRYYGRNKPQAGTTTKSTRFRHPLKTTMFC